MLNKLMNKVIHGFKPYYRNAVKGRLKLYTINDLVNELRKDLNIFASYDGIIGIQRSGILPASIIAMMIGKPLGTVDNIIDGYLYFKSKKVYKNFNKLLLVDDSTIKGETIKNNLNILGSNSIKNVETYCVFVHDWGYKDIDKYSKVIEKRTIYE